MSNQEKDGNNDDIEQLIIQIEEKEETLKKFLKNLEQYNQDKKKDSQNRSKLK